MTRRPEFRVVPPSLKPEPAAKRRSRKAKSETRSLEHVRYGEGKLVWVRQLDSGDYVVSVKFGDGAERVIQLRQQYWVSDIRDLIPEPSKPLAQTKPSPKRSPMADEDNQSYVIEEDSVDSSDDAGEGGDTEPELGEERVEEVEDEVEAEEIGAFA
jgi:hypothetical protein